MIDELAIIIGKVKERISDDSDVVWTGYNSAKELREEIDLCMDQLKSGNLEGLEKLNSHFLPTCTFQEHSTTNGWADEYLGLAEQFDKIYYSLRK